MNIDERKAKLGTGKRFAALEKKLSHKKGIRDPAAVAAAHGRKTLGKKRFQELAAAGRRRHNESAEQIVSRLLEDDGAPGIPGNTGAVYNPEILRIKIRQLMQQLGIDYEAARDIAMTQHDPRGQATTAVEDLDHPPEQTVMDNPQEKHCGRCGSKHHRTKDCHLLGIPI